MKKQTKQQANIPDVDSEAKNEIIPESPLNETPPPSNVEEAKGDYNKGNKSDKTDHDEEMNCWRRHPRRKAWVILVFTGAIAVILLAVLLPLRNGGSTDANKRWVSMNVEFSNDAAESPNEIAFTKNQVHLTSNRMFEVRKRTNQIFIYKYNATGGTYEQGMWALEKDLSLPTKEDSDFIRNIAPSMDGKRLAIAYPENVTVLEETSPDTWTRITVVAPLMLEPFVNASSLYKFGHDAVSLSKDGRLLTLWSAVVTTPHNEENQEYQPALVAAFRDEGEEWRMIDQQHELIVSPVFIFELPVIAASGDVVAVQAYGGNGSGYNRKELVQIYDYNLATKWALSDTVVEPSHSELLESFFGQSKAFSYDGSVLAVGALNQKLGDHRFGLVQVYQKDNGKYLQKGQTLEAAGGIFRFGEHLALSQRGDRLAVSSTLNGDYKVQVYKYRDGHWELMWNPFSEFDDPIDSISMSPNGDRVAVERNCDPPRARCVSVFEERSL